MTFSKYIFGENVVRILVMSNWSFCYRFVFRSVSRRMAAQFPSSSVVAFVERVTTCSLVVGCCLRRSACVSNLFNDAVYVTSSMLAQLTSLSPFMSLFTRLRTGARKHVLLLLSLLSHGDNSRAVDRPGQVDRSSLGDPWSRLATLR